MNLPTEIFGNVVVVHAPEEINHDRSNDLVDCLTSLDRDNLVLDIDGTETVDSIGLEALLRTQQVLRETGGDLKISTTIDTNRKILEITRLDERLEVFDSVIEAVKSYS